MEWINAAEQKPPSGKFVLLFYKVDFPKALKISDHSRNIIVVGCWTDKFTDDNYDTENEFAEYDEESDTFYVPEGWYERTETNPDYVSMFLDNQNILFWAELPQFPTFEKGSNSG